MSNASQVPHAGKPPVSTLAVVALIMSVLAWWCLGGLFLGVIALVRINKRGGALGGKTLAILAISLNLALIPACGGIVAAVAIPALVRYECVAKQGEARANLKALFVAEEQYRAEHEDYTDDLAALGFQPMGDRLRYRYAVVSASPQGFSAEARGTDDMAGDVWAITNANELVNAGEKCRPRLTRRVSLPPTDAALRRRD